LHSLTVGAPAGNSPGRTGRAIGNCGAILLKVVPLFADSIGKFVFRSAFCILIVPQSRTKLEG
jgi:hypothetical protein